MRTQAKVASLISRRHAIIVQQRRSGASSTAASILAETEATALWEPSSRPITNLEDATKFFIRSAMSPFTSLPFPGQVRTTEDLLGTDITSPDVEYATESRAVWLDHFRQRYLTICRLERNNGAGMVGIVSDTTSAVPDEADHPDTPWGKDTAFAKQLQLARPILGDGLSNREELESAIRTCTPETFFLYCEALLESPVGDSLQLLTPTPSFQAYQDVKQREAWCAAFQKARLASEDTVGRIRQTLFQTPWPAIAAALGAQHELVIGVVSSLVAEGVEESARDAGWCGLSLESQQRIAAWVEGWRRSAIQSGNLSTLPDGSSIGVGKEASDKAVARLTALCAEKVPVLDIPYGVVWRDCVRLDLLETDHVFTDPRFVDLSVRCFMRLAAEKSQPLTAAAAGAAPSRVLSVAHVVEATLRPDADAIKDSQMDVRGGFIAPAVTNDWIKLNWPRYGASGQVQRPPGAAAARVHHANYAALGAAKAIAALHFRCKSLAATMDYSTPFRYRQSIVDAYANCHADIVLGNTRPLNDATRWVFRAEDALASVALVEGWRVSCARRLAVAKGRAERSRASDILPIANVTVAATSETANDARTWRAGTSRSVSFAWPAAFPSPVPSNIPPAERAAYEAKQSGRFGLEVSLWTQGPWTTIQNAPVAKRVGEAFAEAGLALAQSPTVRDCQAVTRAQLRDLGFDTSVSDDDAKQALEAAQAWSFVALLTENASVNAERRVEVTLPLAVPSVAPWTPYATPLHPPVVTRPLAAGTYRLRLRLFEHEVNPAHSDDRPYVEAYSDSFQAFDDLDDVIVSFLLQHESAAKTASLATIPVVPAANYVAVCDHLRSKGYHVPLDVEVEGGQTLTLAGDVVASNLKKLLQRSSAVTATSFRSGLTESQLAAEPHVYHHWSNFVQPGALEFEWFSQRRRVLDDAFDHEREWWRHDGMIADAQEISTEDVRAFRRYNVDLTSVLTARGEAGRPKETGAATAAKDDAGPVATRCQVNGLGAVTSLGLDAAVMREGKWSLDEVVDSCSVAYRRAHNRLNTLTETKFRRFNQHAFHNAIMGSAATSFSGKYAPTFAYAWQTAKKRIGDGHTHEPEARVSMGGGPALDRFPSEDNPELRHKRNIPNFSFSAQNQDDPLPEQKREWK